MTIVETALAFPPQLQIGPNTCYIPDSSPDFTRSVFRLYFVWDANDILTVRLFDFSFTTSFYTWYKGSLVSVISSNIYEALVVIFTSYRTTQLILQSNLKKEKFNESLIFILLRDGTCQLNSFERNWFSRYIRNFLLCVCDFGTTSSC